MEPLDKVDEQRIMTALGKAIDMTNTGTAPDEAIYKIASEAQLTPPFVRRMVEAFNVSKTLAHFKHASAEEKDAIFPLADSEVVLSRMYPAKVESTIQSHLKAAEDSLRTWASDRDFSKVASDIPWEKIHNAEYPQDRDTLVRQAYNVRDRMRAHIKQAESDARMSYWKFMDALTKAAEHFSLITHEPENDFAARVCDKYGVLGATMLDSLRSMTKKSSAVFLAPPSEPSRRIYPTRSPYIEIDEAIKSARDMTNYVAQAVSARKVAEQWESIQVPFLKSSAILGDSTFGQFDLGMDLGRKFGLIPEKESATALAAKAKTKALDDIFDPAQEADLRATKVKILMNDFMTNDPVLSTYPPEKVIGAYNQLSQFAPQAATEPLLVRGVLRKMMQTDNALEQFDVKDISELERSINQREPLTHLHFCPSGGGASRGE